MAVFKPVAGYGGKIFWLAVLLNPSVIYQGGFT
jgi:hypothetical protein